MSRPRHAFTEGGGSRPGQAKGAGGAGGSWVEKDCTMIVWVGRGEEGRGVGRVNWHLQRRSSDRATAGGAIS
jgi:hypothetical protein